MSKPTIASLTARVAELEAHIAQLTAVREEHRTPRRVIHPADAAQFAKMQAARAEAMRTGKSVLVK
jgi:hypothetical protein